MTRTSDPTRVVLRGGHESRAALTVVALVFVGIVPLAVNNSNGDLVSMLFLIPAIVIPIWLFILIARSAVIIDDTTITIRHFADLRLRRIARNDVKTADLVNIGNELIPAVCPRLHLHRHPGKPTDPGRDEALLTPLTTWTWWRRTIPRAERDLDRLRVALDLPGDGR